MAIEQVSDTQEPSARQYEKKELILEALNASIQEEHSLALLRDGLKLFARERKVFLKYVMGVLASVMLTLTIGFIFHTLFQIFAVGHLEALLAGSFDWPSWMSFMSHPEHWVRNAGKWLIFVISYLIIVYVSVRLAFLFMIYWTDEMVAMVMKLNRNRPDMPLDVKRMTLLLKVGMRFALRTLVVTLLFFFLSWIPFIGYPIFLLSVAWSSGKDIISTVTMVYAEEEITIPDELRIPFRNSVKLGWVYGVLYSIPLVGLLLLPLVYMMQVCAFVMAVETRMRVLALGEQAN